MLVAQGNLTQQLLLGIVKLAGAQGFGPDDVQFLSTKRSTRLWKRASVPKYILNPRVLVNPWLASVVRHRASLEC